MSILPRPKVFPPDQDTHEAVCLGPLKPNGSLVELLRTVSDRRTGEVEIRIGPMRAVLSGDATHALLGALMEHISHLGEATQFMVDQRVERWYVPDDGDPRLGDYKSRWVRLS